MTNLLQKSIFVEKYILNPSLCESNQPQFAMVIGLQDEPDKGYYKGTIVDCEYSVACRIPVELIDEYCKNKPQPFSPKDIKNYLFTLNKFTVHIPAGEYPYFKIDRITEFCKINDPQNFRPITSVEYIKNMIQDRWDDHDDVFDIHTLKPLTEEDNFPSDQRKRINEMIGEFEKDLKRTPENAEDSIENSVSYEGSPSLFSASLDASYSHATSVVCGILKFF
eukprot:TRINITY_DN9364_c0_g1_i2.p1 TRINITY_DN9364_c0_g1~~TRINITY_DN9364_c0_g1_i2.p1  ORF type:complete len:222 (+),score=49.77 TRINITY_DN9364_c0_g1_i2:8-673(+)